MLKMTFAAAGFGLMVVAPAFGQQMTAQDFVTKAASGGMYEVQSSQLITDQKAPEKVNDFAQQMIEDHTKANDKLKTLAEEQNLDVPSKMQPAQQQMLDKLESAKNKVQTYEQQQLSAHKETVEMFQQYAKQGDNPQLKQFAEQTLPTLKEHLKMAQALPKAE